MPIDTITLLVVAGSVIPAGFCIALIVWFRKSHLRKHGREPDVAAWRRLQLGCFLTIIVAMAAFLLFNAWWATR